MTAEPVARVVAELRAGRYARLGDADPTLVELGDLLVRRTDVPVVDATSIYESLVGRDTGINLYGDHTIPPAWAGAQICYVNQHGNVAVMPTIAAERRRDGDGWSAEPDWDITDQSVDWTGCRWLIEAMIFVGGRSATLGMAMPTRGPVFVLRYAVGPQGEPLDLHWIDLLHSVKDAGRMPQEWDMAMLVHLGVLDFLACRNVSLRDVEHPNRSAARRLARTGVTVKTLTVRSVGTSTRSGKRDDPAGVPLTSVHGHFCVDADTEILTQRGWLRHERLQAGDIVAGYDLDLGVGRWTGCQAVHRYDYDGPLVGVEARALSMRLTPNHRAIAKRNRRVDRGWEIIEAARLRPKHRIMRSLPSWVDTGAEKGIGLDLAALVGWVGAEGHVRPDGHVGLCQSSIANPDHVATIDALLARIDLPLADRSGRVRRHQREGTGGRSIEPGGMVRWMLPLGLSQQVLAQFADDKTLSPSLICLPLVEAEALLEAFIDGDGHRTGSRTSLLVVLQKRRESLDVLEAIAVRCGWKASLTWSSADHKWRLALSHGPAATMRRADGTSLIEPVAYRGVVWCPTTGTGTFIARRNGHVFVTGNSHYGDCCAGRHATRGLAFGKLTGRYWVPQHARGDPAYGEHRNDYALEA